METRVSIPPADGGNGGKIGACPGIGRGGKPGGCIGYMGGIPGPPGIGGIIGGGGGGNTGPAAPAGEEMEIRKIKTTDNRPSPLLKIVIDSLIKSSLTLSSGIESGLLKW